MPQTTSGNAGTQGQLLSGAEILFECLAREGVDCMFGYPGGVTLPLNDAIYSNPLRHVLVRHEQNAAFAAQGYARATGKVGVCCATSGPGATNLVTGLVDAMMDSILIVAITGQDTSSLIGSDAFQEADTFGITRSATKHNFMVKNVKELAQTIHEAFAGMRSIPFPMASRSMCSSIRDSGRAREVRRWNRSTPRRWRPMRRFGVQARCPCWGNRSGRAPRRFWRQGLRRRGELS